MMLSPISAGSPRMMIVLKTSARQMLSRILLSRVFKQKSPVIAFAITGLTRHLPLTYPRFYGIVLRHTGRSMNVRLKLLQASAYYIRRVKKSQYLSSRKYNTIQANTLWTMGCCFYPISNNCLAAAPAASPLQSRLSFL